MSLMFIRVLAGFLAGLAAGILIMRMAYKKTGVMKPGNSDPTEAATSARAS
ncbi:MAG TPA: hypothetical protein VII95_15100 [Terriglobales bacterium]|jgi:hypothetical protein